MKPISYTRICTIVLSLFLSITTTMGQTFGTVASAVWISDCNQSNYFNTSGSGVNLIGPSGNVFTNSNLGAHTQNSGTLFLRGAEVKTFKSPGVTNACSVRLHYRIYTQTGAPGSFSLIDLPLVDDCNVPPGQYPSGGSCSAGDQKWSRVIEDGETTPYAPVDLTSFAPGNYVLELYYDVAGSSSSTTLCTDTAILNNGGANYKAFFSVQSPVLASTNPTTCNGTEGAITISGLVPGITYAVSYSDDGVSVGPNNLVANGAGEVVISGLNAGVYADFELNVNGCTTDLNTGLILSNPVFTPKFNKISAFCAGSTPPTLSTKSTNGISGSWNPATINNQTSGTYTFTPSAGQCGIPLSINVTVNPNKIPTFSFGSSLTICAGSTVPLLPTTSTNGVTGNWSPSTVSNTTSGNYTFTPVAGQCATTTTFSVTVSPNIVPSFSFGTTLTICAGATVPTLPTTSANGITGTWNPSSVSNQNSGTYTFTPTTGQCATTTTFNVTVNPKLIPAFDFGSTQTICAGANVPTLPNTSNNGITGTWNPAVVNKQASGIYTFTPAAGTCASQATFTVTVNSNITPTFGFGSGIIICSGGVVPTLPSTSINGINGSWSPATVSNTASAIYAFTPTAGQCASTTTFTVTVNPNITPSFSFGTSQTICAGQTAPVLPKTSNNGVTGVWSPATVSNSTSGTYTFTPSPGQCATSTSLTVTVNPNITPTFSFGTSLTICAGGAVPTLPTVSSNGINGAWSSTVVDNQTSRTYTFTPSGGQCATTTTFSVTVTPKLIPTFSFGTGVSICANGVVPTLPNTSTNGITGVWNPSVVDNQNTAVYTFTPTAGQCATPITFSVTVNPIIEPSFTFGSSLAICAGEIVPGLPTTSTNSITGAWNPSVINNQTSGTYTFTPSAGQCASTVTFTVSVNAKATPLFDFGTSLTICAGETVPNLVATSSNGITGTWNPKSINNQASGTYTFTPSSGQCATATKFTVTVNPTVAPVFNFGTVLSICAGGAVPTLPTTSSNNINGIWNPATVSNQQSGTYTFTPEAGQCAVIATLTVNVNPNITPTFNFGTSLAICSGTTVPKLPLVSNNGITGVWSPSTVSNQTSGTYTFTPASGQCALATTLTVTVTPSIIPTFNFGTTLSICTGGNVPVLPTTSENNVKGTWSPSTASNTASGVYTFTPTAVPGQCIAATTFTITVNPIVTPTFDFGTAMTLCSGSNPPTLPTTSKNGISGYWNPAIIDNKTSGVYTFTTAAGQCTIPSVSLTVTVPPVATVVAITDTTVTDGMAIPVYTFTGTPTGVSYDWTNTDPSIGLAASGTGNTPSFTAINKGSSTVNATITVTPKISGCAGTARSYKIHVIPLDKDVFVPNVFSPNGDGKNDVLYVYGNYISKLDMRIFNQWGEQVEKIDNKAMGWDGRYKGQAQPVGVYVYILQAELTDGRKVKLKGSITLVR